MYDLIGDIHQPMHGVAYFSADPIGFYITSFGFDSDEVFTKYLIEQIGVAPVPGYSFFHDPSAGRRYVRFAFPKRDETFAEVRRRLGALRPRAAVPAEGGARE